MCVTKMTTGEIAKLTGCTTNTARKRLNRLASIGRVIRLGLTDDGCRIWDVGTMLRPIAHKHMSVHIQFYTNDVNNSGWIHLPGILPPSNGKDRTWIYLWAKFEVSKQFALCTSAVSILRIDIRRIDSHL